MLPRHQFRRSDYATFRLIRTRAVHMKSWIIDVSVKFRQLPLCTAATDGVVAKAVPAHDKHQRHP